MQKHINWSVNKALPLFCIIAIFIVCPLTLLYWRSHPVAEQQVSNEEHSALSAGNNQPDLELPVNAGPPPMAPGAKAPDFVSSTVDGSSYMFKSQSPNIKVVDFWATWCGPCHMSIPGLETLHNDLQSKGVDVIGVSVDTDTASQVPKYVDDNGMTYTVLVDPKSNGVVQESYNANALPSLYIIDNKGIVRWSFSGYWSGEDDYVRAVIAQIQSGQPVTLP